MSQCVAFFQKVYYFSKKLLHFANLYYIINTVDESLTLFYISRGNGIGSFRQSAALRQIKR